MTGTGDGADKKGNSSRVKLEMLKFTEPVGEERGSEEGWKEMESKGLLGWWWLYKSCFGEIAHRKESSPKGGIRVGAGQGD